MGLRLRNPSRLAWLAAVILASCAPDEGVDATRARAPGVGKILVDTHSAAAEQLARSRGAVVGEVDYGSFRMLLVDERAAGTMGLALRDDLNRVLIEGIQLDTRRPGDVESALPVALRRDELVRSQAEGRAPRDGL